MTTIDTELERFVAERYPDETDAWMFVAAFRKYLRRRKRGGTIEESAKGILTKHLLDIQTLLNLPGVQNERKRLADAAAKRYSGNRKKGRRWKRKRNTETQPADQQS